MVTFKPESLVLCGSVLRDSVAVSLRLGVGAKDHAQTPGTANSWQHPLPGCRTPEGKPGVNPGVADATPGIMPGAGRSRRQSGSCSLSAAASIALASRQPVSLREREAR
jgi:hypothetical protein